MPQTNPYIDQIATITARMAEIQRELDKIPQYWANLQGRVDDYGISSALGGAAYRELQQSQQAVTVLRTELAELQTKVAALKKSSDAWEQARAEFVASGMSEADATALATAQAQRSQLITNIVKGVAVLGLIAVVIYGIVLFVRWKKRK